MMTHRTLPPAYFYAPATDTREMPALRRGVPLADQPTEVLGLLDLYPPTPDRAIRRRWRRLVRRQAVEDRRPLRAAIRSAFWPLVIGCGLLVGLALHVAAPALTAAAVNR